ncbi:MAG: pantoate--beta-alanine ligase [Pyrinomonadaceae bacterium]
MRDLVFETEIVVLPTVREESGLALSSRNLFLNSEERRAAAVLRRGLATAEELYAEGERSAKRISEAIRAEIETEPLVRLQYLSIADADSLEKLDKLDDRNVLISLAAYVGKTRLIDNTVLQPATPRQRVRTGLEL